MLFHSTRGKDKDKTFEQVLMQGLADDGGLFIPDNWPKVDINKLKELDTFLDVAKYIVPMFTQSSFDKGEVEEVLNNTWHNFSEKDLIKIFDIDESTAILELFHGPTAAFKDFGLQLAAAFFNKTLQTQNKTAVVFGATSGDTGSAAIDACKEFDLIKSFILIPDGNMSEIQRKQMTTVDKSNVFPILVSGTFDDCQDIVKKGFSERSFLRDDQYLLAVNSINWVRIIGQICYYFYASLIVNKLSHPLNFSVPTGNFGNVFACYAASKMGMPLEKIIVAVNSNDILDRFFKNNDYSKKTVSETISPSMDISVASNFERLVYDFYLNRNSEACSNLYNNFPEYGIKIDDEMWQKSVDLFMSYSINDDSTYESMKFYNNEYNYVMDPHTAVAAKAVSSLKDKLKNKTIILSTAHPAKFPNALDNAGIISDDIPDNLSEVISKKEVASKLSASEDSIFNYIKENVLLVDSKIERLNQIESDLSKEEVWSDLELSQKLSKEKTSIDKAITSFNEVSNKLSDSMVLLDVSIEENDDSSIEEIFSEAKEITSTIEALEFSRMFTNKMDSSSAYIEIQSGSGGTEAQDWAEMILRMYTKWSESRGFKSDLIEISHGDVAGIKSASLYVDGDYAYGWLRTETGIHRLVRKSPFDSGNRRHTSFASVFISPEIDDSIEININKADIRIDTYRASGAGGQHVNKTDSAVRLTHIPSGVVAQSQSDRSQHKNKENALKQLKSKLYELELQKQNEEQQILEDSKSDIGWGSQIRSYVLDQSRIKDLRTNFETGNTAAVLNGDLDDFMKSSLKAGV